MTILTEAFVFDALQAEREGEKFPVVFDDIWECFGYNRKDNARRYLTTRSGLKPFGIEGFLRLELAYNQSAENNKICLSVTAFKFALARAGTEQGEKYLLHLLEIEERYLTNLNRLLDAVEDPEIEVLKSKIAELEAENFALQIKLGEATEKHLEFSYSLDYLHQVSRIVNKSQVKSAVTRDFLEGRDYIFVEDRVFINESTFNILVLSFRSLRGTDVSQLPETIRITTRVYFQYQEMKRKNGRIAQTDAFQQMSLF